MPAFVVIVKRGRAALTVPPGYYNASGGVTLVDSVSERGLPTDSSASEADVLVHISRGIDHLGWLNAQLRDLSGYATLASELIQNADDAPEATFISFDVTDDALVVDNDGYFTDCGQAEEGACLWPDDPAHGFKCDFHRFRTVASGDKRLQEDTVGAFGIGFVAVYQVTDRPEVISSHRHWIVDETAAHDERIGACQDPACTRRHGSVEVPTRFILPWAMDGESELRQKLGMEPFTQRDVIAVFDGLKLFLPNAFLFLRKLSKASLKRNGEVVLTVERCVDGDDLLIETAGSVRAWRLFSGDFEEEARELRDSGLPIDAKRRSRVSVAVPEDPADLSSGLLFAFLPTQHGTGVPLHINADFFPSSDRKRIILEGSFQARWNEAALACASRVLAANLESLHQFTGAERFWDIMEAAQRAARDPGSGPLAGLWGELSSTLVRTEIVLCADGRLRLPEEVCTPSRDAEQPATTVLSELAAAILHTSLRKYSNVLRSSDVGVRTLSLSDVAEVLLELGLSSRTPPEALPGPLRSDEALPVLWKAIESLDDHQSEAQYETTRVEIRRCALAPGIDGAFWPFDRLYSCSGETGESFSRVLAVAPVAAQGTVADRIIERYCEPLSAGSAVQLLREALEQDGVSPTRDDATDLIRWFARHAPELDDEMAQQLAALPLFPVGTGLSPLRGLSLPSGFTDPLGLAQLVDLHGLEGLEGFLETLGAEELDLHHYVTHHVPHALSGGELDGDHVPALLDFLAVHLPELSEDSEARTALASVPMILCRDGERHSPDECYFLTPSVLLVLPEAEAVVEPTSLRPYIEALYRWLGVPEEPRADDVVHRVEELSQEAVTPASVAAVQDVLRFLIAQRTTSPEEGSIKRLRDLTWLPAEGDLAWHRPAELFAVYRRHIFSSQALFLDLPPRDQNQNQASDVLRALGIGSEPSVGQVIAHLRFCVAQQLDINKAIYQFLNDNADDHRLPELADEPCLLTPGGGYMRPDQVYWSEHRFGRFRQRLDQSLRSLADFLDAVGVKQEPSPEDAVGVLLDIEREYGEFNQPPDAAARWVIDECWRMLGAAPEEGGIEDGDLRSLSSHSVYPSKSGLLNKPSSLFLDDRPGWVGYFDSFFESNLVDAMQDIVPALRRAGVRPLSEAVERQVVSVPDLEADTELRALLSERRASIARALGLQLPLDAITAAIAELDAAPCVKQRRLEVVYEVNAFNSRHRFGPFPAQACWDEATGNLHRDTSLPLSDVRLAQELAYRLCPSNTPTGPVALAIAAVLAASSVGDAENVLIQLGYPMVDLEPGTSGAGEVMTSIGTEGEELPYVPPEPPETPAPAAVGTAGSEGEHVEHLAPEGAGDHEQEPVAGASGPSDGARRGGNEGDGGSHGADGSGQKGSRSRGGKQGEYVTYVVHEREEDQPSDDDDGRRRLIEEAGVRLAVAFEEDHFRYPRVMPPGNPGYDIESADGSGEIERYIEVKATSEDWREAGVKLTAREYDTARELRENYWLYVVERADHDDARLYRIQDPASLVNRYVYNGGWRALAEE